MKVIDAFWEKRNLGVETVEFEVEKSDDTDEVKHIIEENEKQYNVVKVPAGNFTLNAVLADMGYIYVESMVRMHHKKKLPSCSEAVMRLFDRISCEKMDDRDIERLYTEIEKGIFSTDRIALDPCFSVEIANRRYINWIKDELGRGGEALKMIYDGEIISFSAYKRLEKNAIFSYIGGFYPEFANSGLALPGSLRAIEYILGLSPSKLVTYVSTNNRNSLALDLESGYTVKGVNDVFIKHKT